MNSLEATIAHHHDGIARSRHRDQGRHQIADVTEQRLAEEARDCAAKNLRALLESVDEAILSLDGDGRILQMRIPDPHGAWMPHPDDSRLMVPVPIDGCGPDTILLLNVAANCIDRHLATRGEAAHSGYPELGHSAIDPLLDALARVRSSIIRGRAPDLPATGGIVRLSARRRLPWTR